MIHYRDMAFCAHYENCAHAGECHRPLTPEVRQAANNWWGGPGAPISVFTDKPLCHSDFDNARAKSHCESIRWDA